MSETKSCFVISPIGEDGSATRKRADQILRYVIKPAVEECGYTANRADEIDELGMITSQIIQRVIDDDLVVADLTESNPNVFYELAIRHVAKKPIIQLIDKEEKIPFDVYDVRTVKMDHRDLDSVAQAKSAIIKQIKSMETNPVDLETPVSVAVGLKELSRSEGLEKHLPLIFHMIKKSIESHSDSVREAQELMRSTVELIDDTRKHLHRFDNRPRGLLSSIDPATLQHYVQDEEEK